MTAIQKLTVLTKKLEEPDGRFCTSHEAYRRAVDKVINFMTEDQAGIDDLGDTVFTWDKWDEGVDPVETACEIMDNDSIGSQWLEVFIMDGEALA